MFSKSSQHSNEHINASLWGMKSANPTPALIKQDNKVMVASGKLSLGELYTLTSVKVVDEEVVNTFTVASQYQCFAVGMALYHPQINDVLPPALPLEVYQYPQTVLISYPLKPWYKFNLFMDKSCLQQTLLSLTSKLTMHIYVKLLMACEFQERLRPSQCLQTLSFCYDHCSILGHCYSLYTI